MGRTIYSRSLCTLYMHRENEWHYSFLCLLRQLSNVEINTPQMYIFRESIIVLWEKLLIKNFHLFHILIAVSLFSCPTVSSPQTPSFAFPLPPSTPSSQFRKGQASHGSFNEAWHIKRQDQALFSALRLNEATKYGA